MKKLKLKMLELGANEILTRTQLKNVLAGDDDATTGAKKYCRTVCSADQGDGDTFEWVHNGKECNSTSDCGTVNCDTSYGPIIANLTNCTAL